MSANLASSIFSLDRVEAQSSGAIDEVVPTGHHAMERVVALGQSIYVRGWAVDASAMRLASRIVLILDGVLGFPAAYGSARADIATIFGVPEFGRAGFDAVLPPVLGLGSHNVAACAVSADGASYTIVATADFTIIPSLVPRPFDAAPNERAPGEIISVCTDGDTRSPMQRAGRIELQFDAGVTVDGWARASRGEFDEVGIVVDDRWFVQGSRKSARRDGLYQTRFVLNFALPGEHVLYAVAKTGRRSYARVSEQIPFESIEPPLPWIWALIELSQPTRAAIEHVSAGGASLTALPPGQAIFVRGWAIDEPAGGPAGGVYVSIDGSRRMAIPARYGHPTHEHLPKGSGFTAMIPTDGLAPGPHTLELLVPAQSWSGYYTPLEPMVFSVTP